MSEIKDIVVQGLWKNNSALVQLLGLCPLLAVTSTATNALGLGLATTLVLTLTNLAVSALRRWTPAEIRIPIYVMIIASGGKRSTDADQCVCVRFVSVFRDFYSADCNELHCCRSRRSVCREKKDRGFPRWTVFPSAWGATGAMFVLGSLREILGNGTLFDGADSLLGRLGKSITGRDISHRLAFPAGDAAARRVYRSGTHAGGKISY
ncbi:Electron transport complex protein RnfE [Salmonella enterica subsp. enterica serovar Sanjuan]|uniref:Electron transport complex protein RnfE n=1 Tax=Salmonella enterica subsp. enterica serovar Sanjuan TaxID=1160765 RepID=A0A3S4G710_SALET|nr:Electron transport complex protein RnfE [Salmonella enterica subsp. enterica serovar Sanjuan]